eukprot:TRINITY_DN50005_c0_g1_i1.p1 TRINITY_DN50005_c0_g1~~TRINITY_DN50005_c0_g1_i1.p1  ORF type:complete len:331 (+),score=62.12 TRINITY_DN50005_c0_g1_i1:22-993(+)
MTEDSHNSRPQGITQDLTKQAQKWTIDRLDFPPRAEQQLGHRRSFFSSREVDSPSNRRVWDSSREEEDDELAPRRRARSTREDDAAPSASDGMPPLRHSRAAGALETRVEVTPEGQMAPDAATREAMQAPHGSGAASLGGWPGGSWMAALPAGGEAVAAAAERVTLQPPASPLVPRDLFALVGEGCCWPGRQEETHFSLVSYVKAGEDDCRARCAGTERCHAFEVGLAGCRLHRQLEQAQAAAPVRLNSAAWCSAAHMRCFALRASSSPALGSNATPAVTTVEEDGRVRTTVAGAAAKSGDFSLPGAGSASFAKDATQRPQPA